MEYVQVQFFELIAKAPNGYMLIRTSVHNEFVMCEKEGGQLYPIFENTAPYPWADENNFFYLRGMLREYMQDTRDKNQDTCTD